MNQYSNPLDYIIRCCEQGLTPSSFDINNAKDELKKLRQNILYETVGWSRINSRGDLYDLSICYNPCLDQDTLLPVYCNKTEYDAKYGKLSK